MYKEYNTDTHVEEWMGMMTILCPSIEIEEDKKSIDSGGEWEWDLSLQRRIH